MQWLAGGWCRKETVFVGRSHSYSFDRGSGCAKSKTSNSVCDFLSFNTDKQGLLSKEIFLKKKIRAEYHSWPHLCSPKCMLAGTGFSRCPGGRPLVSCSGPRRGCYSKRQPVLGPMARWVSFVLWLSRDRTTSDPREVSPWKHPRARVRACLGV